uniref:Uncharacterized protein n=1 Tax=Knipowitschia caucasica TaxID=637954 RepID=A0AAV2LTG5_KNICA
MGEDSSVAGAGRAGGGGARCEAVPYSLHHTNPPCVVVALPPQPPPQPLRRGGGGVGDGSGVVLYGGGVFMWMGWGGLRFGRCLFVFCRSWCSRWGVWVEGWGGGVCM